MELWFANISSQLIVCIFTLGEKVFNFERFQSTIFYAYAFGVLSKNPLHNPGHGNLLLCFLKVLHVICMSMIHFQLIFYKIWCIGWGLLVCIWMTIVSKSFVGKTFLSSLNCICSFLKNYIMDIFLCVYFWSLLCSIYLFLYPFTSIILFFVCIS